MSEHTVLMIEHLIGDDNTAIVWIVSICDGPSFFIVESQNDTIQNQFFPFSTEKNSHSRALRKALQAAEIIADISI